MAGAKSNYIWITLQSHLNIVAVAALLEVAAVIITENAQPDPATIAKANEQGVILLSTSKFTYEIDGKLWRWASKLSNEHVSRRPARAHRPFPLC
jgi:hypothetical protein